MQRDDFSCQFCTSDTETLNVHHKKYENGKEPWEYENHFLVTLCEDCHEMETLNRKDSEAKLIKSFLKLNVSHHLISELAYYIEHSKQTHMGDVLFSVAFEFLRSESFQRKITDLYFEELKIKGVK